jgi:hypothetical protein
MYLLTAFIYLFFKKKKAHAEHICLLPVQHAHSSAPPKLEIVILEKLSAI